MAKLEDLFKKIRDEATNIWEGLNKKSSGYQSKSVGGGEPEAKSPDLRVGKQDYQQKYDAGNGPSEKPGGRTSYSEEATREEAIRSDREAMQHKLQCQV